MRRVTGRQAWGGQPGRCPARQKPRYQPAPSQACPALGRPEPNTLSACLWPAPGGKSQGGPGSGPLGGSVRAVASPLPLIIWIPPCEAPERGLPAEKQRDQGPESLLFPQREVVRDASVCADPGWGSSRVKYMKAHWGQRSWLSGSQALGHPSLWVRRGCFQPRALDPGLRSELPVTPQPALKDSARTLPGHTHPPGRAASSTLVSLKSWRQTQTCLQSSPGPFPPVSPPLPPPEGLGLPVSTTHSPCPPYPDQSPLAEADSLAGGRRYHSYLICIKPGLGEGQ